MKFEVVEDTPKSLRVALSGIYDPVADAGFGSKFMAMTGVEGQDVVVDISGVPVLLSVVIGTLVNAVKVVTRKGAKFVLLNPQPEVAMNIESLHLTNLFAVAKDEAGAQLILSQPAPKAVGQP